MLFSNDLYLRITVTFVANTLGGWVDTWHIYKPASSFSIGFMCKRQLFGYWNVTLIRGSPLYVTFPTVSKENLSVVRRTHITWFVDNDCPMFISETICWSSWNPKYPANSNESKAKWEIMKSKWEDKNGLLAFNKSEIVF